MNFVEGYPMYRKEHDYLFVFVDGFNKICILIPYKNTITYQDTTNLFFRFVLIFLPLLCLIGIQDLWVSFGSIYRKI